MTESKTIKTVSDAIDALGGPMKIAAYLGIDEAPVSLWRKRGLPAKFSWALYDALEDEKLEFDDKLLGQREPAATWKDVAEGRVVYRRKKKKKKRDGR